NQDALIRQEHAEQHQGKNQIRAAKFPLGQNIAVHRTDERRNDCGRNDEKYAVPKTLFDAKRGRRFRRAEPCNEETFDSQNARWQPHRLDLQRLRLTLEARHEHNIDGHQEPDGEQNQERINDNACPMNTYGATSRDSCHQRASWRVCQIKYGIIKTPTIKSRIIAMLAPCANSVASNEVFHIFSAGTSLAKPALTPP